MVATPTTLDGQSDPELRSGARSQTVPCGSIGELIRLHAERRPDACAILASGLAPFSFGDMESYLAQTGDMLAAVGIGAGSRVGVAFPRTAEAALVNIALACHATVVPFNPAATHEENAADARDTRLDALFVPAWTDLPAWLGNVRRDFGVFHVAKANRSLAECLVEEVSPVPVGLRKTGRVTADSAAAIFKTSGTTGTPKRIPVIHRNLIAMTGKLEQWLGLSVRDRAMCVTPIYYNAGFKLNLVAPLVLGGSIAFPATADIRDFGRWIAGLRPTWFNATPAYLQNWLDAIRSDPDRGRRVKHSLRFVMAGSCYLPEAVGRGLEEELGVPILEFYGLCEAGVMASNRPDPAQRKIGTCGPAPAGEVEIVDRTDGRIMPRGVIGDVGLRGDSVTPGYLVDVEGPPAGWDHGWLFPGDRGYVDQDGFLVLVGRTNEIINRGGEKISPYEVEKVLLRHPGVREAAVFAVPHARLGESVAAAVVPNSEAEPDPAELVEFLHGRLASFKVPRQVLLLPELPAGGRGKISRSALAEMYSRRRSSRHAPRNDAERRIAEMWAKYLGQAEFGIDDDFLDAGGDSLQAVDMMLGVEASFGRQIPRSALSSSLTIRRLAEAVAAHPAGDQELVLRGNAKRGGTPFFFCHGDLVGGGLYALQLAKAMEPCAPVFLVHPCRDFGRDVTLTYEGMARSYVPEILALCPEGRFRLGGFCNGGLLAWEIARQLRMAGREVDVVVMVDSLSQNGSSLFRMAGHGLALFGCDIRQRGMFALWRLAKRCDMRLFRLGTESPGATENAMQPTGYDPADLPWIRSVPVIAGYVPPALDIRLVCLLSEEAARRKENAPEAWRGICSELAVEVIPGDHGTCKTVHLEELARTLLRHVADEDASSRLREPARSRNGAPKIIQ